MSGSRSTPRISQILSLALLVTSACVSGEDPAREVPQLSSEIDLRIEGSDRPFSRVDWIAVHPSGVIAVLEGGPPVVHLFDRAGQLLRTIPHGRGPGEVFRPMGLGFIADTLWVFDPGNGRILFSPMDGDPASSLRMTSLSIPGSDLTAVPTGLLPDGSLYALSRPSLQAMVDQDTAFVRWHRFDREGDYLGEIERVNMSGNMTRIDLPPPIGVPRFVRRPFTGGPSLAFSPGDATLVRVEAVDGGVRIGRRGYRAEDWLFQDTISLPSRTVTLQDRDSTVAALASRFAGSGGDPDPLEPIVREAIRWPSEANPVRGITAGIDGTVWLQLDGERDSFLLRVDELGETTGRLDLPERVQVMQGARNELWGVASSELGVQTVVRVLVND